MTATLQDLVETLLLVHLHSSLTTSLDVDRVQGDGVEPTPPVCFHQSLSVRPHGDESIERLAECCHKCDLMWVSSLPSGHSSTTVTLAVVCVAGRCFVGRFWAKTWSVVLGKEVPTLHVNEWLSLVVMCWRFVRLVYFLVTTRVARWTARQKADKGLGISLAHPLVVGLEEGFAHVAASDSLQRTRRSSKCSSSSAEQEENRTSCCRGSSSCGCRPLASCTGA